MPYNGSGTFNVFTPGNPVVTDTVVSSSVHNSTTSDIAAGLSQAMTRSGQSPATGNIPLGNNKLTGVANGALADDAATIQNLQRMTGVYCATVGGTATAITLAPSPAITSYVTGMTFAFIAASNCAGATTVAVSGLAAKALTKRGSVALVTNDFVANQLLTVVYDGTRFQLNDAFSFDASSVNWSLTGSGTTRNVDIKLQESFVSITDMGATSGSDQTAAIQAVIDLAKTYGRTIKVPSAGGAFWYTALDLDDIDNGIKFVGEGHPYRGGISGALDVSELRCIAATGADGISVRSSFGVTFEDLYLSYSNSGYTGNLIVAGHSARALDTAHLNINRCKLAGHGGAVDNASALLKLDKVIISNIKGTLFQYATTGITVPTVSYVNALTIDEESLFVLLTGDAIVFTSGCQCQGINILNSTFEPRVDGTESRIICGASGGLYGYVIAGNWFGDATAARSWISLSACFGGTIYGNYFSVPSPDYGIDMAGCNGAIITGNTFAGKALNLTSASPAISFHNNDCQTGDTSVAWTGTQPDLYRNAGMTDKMADLRMAGAATQSLYIKPTGATNATQIYQTGNTLRISTEGTANFFNMNMATGAMYLPYPSGTEQTACAVWAGNGAPSNANGSDGDIYFRSDGGAGTTMYLKVTGAWVGRA